MCLLAEASKTIIYKFLWVAWAVRGIDVNNNRSYKFWLLKGYKYTNTLCWVSSKQHHSFQKKEKMMHFTAWCICYTNTIKINTISMLSFIIIYFDLLNILIQLAHPWRLISRKWNNTWTVKIWRLFARLVNHIVWIIEGSNFNDYTKNSQRARSNC